MEIKKPFDVFISYQSGDREWVFKLKAGLERKEIKVWIDQEKIRPGERFVDALERGLSQSKAMALIVSPNSMKSGWVKEEYHHALDYAQNPKENLQLIPVILRKAKLPGFLKSRSWVDFSNPAQFRKSLDKLVWGITGAKVEPTRIRELIPRVYRQHLQSELSDLETLVGSDTPLLFRLQQVYVPLRTNWRKPEREKNKTKDPESPHFPGGERMHADRPLAELLELKDRRHFLILGGPGTGKSTFVRFSALAELSRKNGRVPLHLQLKDFGEWLGGRASKDGNLLVEWAGEIYAKQKLNPNALMLRSSHGRLLWLLDGLDEIFDTGLRLRASQIIGDWLRNEGQKDCIVVTSRPHAVHQQGLLAALGLREAQASILPLSLADQEVYLRLWFQALYPKESRKKAEAIQQRLWEAMENNPGLADLRDNPLMLSTIATICHQGKTLPERRADLYGKAVDVLLNNRFGTIAGGGDARVRRVRQGVIAVARKMQELGRVRDIPEIDFRHYLEEGLYSDRPSSAEEKSEIEGFARILGCHSGLLSMSGDPPRYSFHHLGFQEYLAARAFGEERAPIESLESRINDSAWKEVILLTSGYLFEAGVGKMGQDFVSGLKKLAEDSPKELSRLTLAVQAAAEAPEGGVPASLAAELRELAQRGIVRRDVPAAKRVELGLALGGLGDPRLGMGNPLRWVRIASGSFEMGTTDPDKRIDEDWREYCAPPHVVTITSEFRLGRFPVTNREYREFVEDGGYEDRRLFSKDGWAWLRMKPERYDSWYERIRKEYSLKEEWKLYFLPGKEPRLWRDGKFNNPSQPVVGVSWFEAGAYCKWLTLKFQSGEITPPEWWNSKSEVSLPTEAQWEFAARGGEGRFYPWGNEPPTDDHANYNQDIGATSPVGAFPVGDSPNELGDMAGNVWEWCRDVWDPKAYQNRISGASDPETVEGDGNLRVLRGGSWNDPPQSLAAPFRFRFRAWLRDYFAGFRCCVAVPPSL